MRKTVEKLLLFVVVMTSFVLFSSCEGAGTELSELMIMQGIGIDVIDNGYSVCVEILNNEQSGSPSGDSNSENKTKIYSANGETVAKALHSLVTKSGNLPLYAHNRVIVVGEKAANSNLGDILDFFERDYDSRSSQLICVAKNATAEEVVRAKLLPDAVKSEILENLLEESYNQSLTPRVRIIDAVNYMKDETTVLAVPAIRIQKSGENENYELDGCALIGKDNSFSGYIDNETAEGIAFLNNKINKGEITATLPNSQKATFLINKGKTKYRIYEENNTLHYDVSVEISCDLDEVEGEEFFSTDDGVLETFQTSAGEAVLKKAENTLVVLQGEHLGDAVRFGKLLRLKEPELYKKYKGDWGAAFKNIEVSLCADITIRRIGEETFHSKKK